MSAIPFTRSLGAQSGVQLNYIIDESERFVANDSGQVFAGVARLTRGRIDKAFEVSRDQMTRMLGKPAKQVPYQLQNQIVWTWKFLEPPNETRGFNVVFSPDYRVIRTEVGPDPDGPDMRGGG